LEIEWVGRIDREQELVLKLVLEPEQEELDHCSD